MPSAPARFAVQQQVISFPNTPGFWYQWETGSSYMKAVDSSFLFWLLTEIGKELLLLRAQRSVSELSCPHNCFCSRSKTVCQQYTASSLVLCIGLPRDHFLPISRTYSKQKGENISLFFVSLFPLFLWKNKRVQINVAIWWQGLRNSTLELKCTFLPISLSYQKYEAKWRPLFFQFSRNDGKLLQLLLCKECLNQQVFGISGAGQDAITSPPAWSITFAENCRGAINMLLTAGLWILFPLLTA